MQDEALRTTTFLLTRADALAYEQQAGGRMTPLGVLALLLWLGLWGVAALFVPTDWAGPRFGWSSSILVSLALAVAYVLALLLIALGQWLRARRRIPRPLEVTVTEWPDRLEIIGLGLPRDIGLADIRDSRLTRSHLLLTLDQGVLILPRHAFAEEGAIEDLAVRIAEAPPAAAVDPEPASA